MKMNVIIYLITGLLLCLLSTPDNKYAQSGQPNSSNFKLDYSGFMSGSMKADNGNTSIVGLLGDPFLRGGSSQSFRFIDNVFFEDNVVTNTENILNLDVPAEFELKQNYPNPFNPSTTIKYSLPGEGFVNLTVYNIIGQDVVELVNEYRRAGYYEEKFYANNLSSGFYIYRITSGSFTATRKMLLIK